MLSDRFDLLLHAKVEIERAREGKERMQKPSGRIADTLDTVNTFGKGLDPGDNVITSVIDFCKKRKDVRNRVAFVIFDTFCQANGSTRYVLYTASRLISTASEAPHF